MADQSPQPSAPALSVDPRFRRAPGQTPVIPERSGSLLPGAQAAAASMTAHLLPAFTSTARPDHTSSPISPSAFSSSAAAGYGSDASEIQRMVRKALELASVAVSLDTDSDYPRSLQAYNDTILLFETICERDDDICMRNNHLGPYRKCPPVPPLGPDTVPKASIGLAPGEKKRIMALRGSYMRRSEILSGVLNAHYAYKPIPADLAAMVAGTPRHLLSQAPPYPLANSSTSSRRSITPRRYSLAPRSYEQTYDELVHNALSTEPAKHPPDMTQQSDAGRTFKMFAALLESMTTTAVAGGADLTHALRIPAQLWVAPTHKLQAVDAKIAVCDAVVAILRPFQTEQQLMVALQRSGAGGSQALFVAELTAAAATLESLRAAMVKKHKFFASGDNTPVSSSPVVSTASLPYQSSSSSSLLSAATAASTRDVSHGIHGHSGQRVKNWGSKLSKGMEKLTSRPSLQHLDQFHMSQSSSSIATTASQNQAGNNSAGMISDSRSNSGGGSGGGGGLAPMGTSLDSLSSPITNSAPPNTPLDAPTAYRDALARCLASASPLGKAREDLLDTVAREQRVLGNSETDAELAARATDQQRAVLDALDAVARGLKALIIVGFLRRDVGVLAARFWKKMRRAAVS
ncbi:hypothetical protein HDU87_002446 [Geranomyces variabilis]|uniref:MIT domain-containing protein n=1 Tax=Geranomyces variabilis TaxID=109894 RepID=A0AAD5TLA7_9FUNG|nr:hypothetical protein HDU87_002446 [Geranomyces variabilis]